ncbi:penicillin-binding protein 1C [Sulfuriferula nivalis]|uniref:peptidoglycan glycosyltransferase n=1 Tax=Sulfuriferula nivalis TaxID=2675298 RepID=A0A809RHH3_9PROT|nr:penicillin-binding protein 1C [Sulfuriferula nivalis]BBP01339.1 penicillin-binding protein 1C [Sulfuriferula nivalis]
MDVIRVLLSRPASRWINVWLLLTGLLTAAAGHAALPTFAEVKAGYVPSDATLLDRNDVVIDQLRIDMKIRRLNWTPLQDISPILLTTVIQAEDKRFYEHAGVDWKALASAAVDMLFQDRQRGASTLTMQLVSQLNPALLPKKNKRTYTQKWDQIAAARELEKNWSKPQILEAYFNLVSFRGEFQGIGAAAKGLFNKTPDGLDEAEALLLSSLLRAPNATPGTVAKRACQLAISAGVKTSCTAIQAKAAISLDRAFNIAPEIALAPHVARRLLKDAGQPVRSTLDAATQQFATQSLFEQLAGLAGSHVQEGAVLVVDNKSGEVLAYVSGGPNSRNIYVDGVLAPRQAGSTLKPFLYSLALEQRLLTAASLIDDAPVNLSTPNGLYVPQNYDHEFKGMVSARLALSGSLNVPAVKTLMLVGTDTFIDRLNALGFDGLTEDGDYYGYSLALGSAEVSLWQLVDGYRTLANSGRYSTLSLTPGSSGKAVQVIDPAAAFVVGDILSDRGARAITFGLDSPLATRYWSAVKTGTSKDMRDNWCVGFSERYTVGVWVGNFNGDAMRDVSGISGAAPVWLEVMNFLNGAAPGRAPTAPQGVVAQNVRFNPAVEPPRREWFLAGTASSVINLAPTGSVRPRIRYPGAGEILALDPDIPPANQAVFFEMFPVDTSMQWQLDGNVLPADTPWHPQSGEHMLVLLDSAGQEVDKVHFVVRGNLRQTSSR